MNTSVKKTYLDLNSMLLAQDVHSALEKSGCKIVKSTFREWTAKGLLPEPKGYTRAARYPAISLGIGAVVWTLRQPLSSNPCGFKVPYPEIREVISFIMRILGNPLRCREEIPEVPIDLSDPENPRDLTLHEVIQKAQQSGKPVTFYTRRRFESDQHEHGFFAFFAAMAGFRWDERLYVQFFLPHPPASELEKLGNDSEWTSEEALIGTEKPWPPLSIAVSPSATKFNRIHCSFGNSIPEGKELRIITNNHQEEE